MRSEISVVATSVLTKLHFMVESILNSTGSCDLETRKLEVPQVTERNSILGFTFRLYSDAEKPGALSPPHASGCSWVLQLSQVPAATAVVTATRPLLSDMNDSDYQCIRFFRNAPVG